MRQFTPNIKAGLEWNVRAGELGVVANWRLLGETETRPAVILGTSSDRIGTPTGQSYYVTLSRSLERETGLPIAPYVGASYSEYEDRILVPFGLSAAINERLSAMLINDGVHTHLSATVAIQRFSVTLLAVERRDFGVTVATRF